MKILMFLLISITIIGCSSTLNYNRMDKEGQVLQATIVAKDYKTLGIIFVESSVTMDSDGNILSGSKITYDMLMKEAQKLGADDFINLRIDEIQSVGRIGEIITLPPSTTPQAQRPSSTQNKNSSVTTIGQQITTITINISYKANALAIRYLP